MVENLCTQRGLITSYGAPSGRRLLLILPCCRARTGADVEPERGQSTPPMRCQRRRICCGDPAGSPVRHRKGVSSQHNRVRNILAEQCHGLAQFVVGVLQQRDSRRCGVLGPGRRTRYEDAAGGSGPILCWKRRWRIVELRRWGWNPNGAGSTGSCAALSARSATRALSVPSRVRTAPTSATHRSSCSGSNPPMRSLASNQDYSRFRTSNRRTRQHLPGRHWLRRSLDLHLLGDWTDDAREFVVFPQDAYPDHAGPYDYTRVVLNAEPPPLPPRRGQRPP